MASNIQKTVLDNGVRIITERLSHSRTSSFGIWTRVGARYEPTKLAGASHFVEHTVFKGTKTRSQFEIAKSIDKFGGELNAFTSREETCFHSHVLNEYGEVAIDVLIDLVMNATFPDDEVKKERQVVLQEIAMIDDTPEELAHDLFYEKVFKSQSLGRSILGSSKTVSSFNRKKILDFYQTYYTPDRWIVTCAGNQDHEQVVRWVKDRMGKDQRKSKKTKIEKPSFHPFVKKVKKGFEQSHIVYAFPVASYLDKKRFEAVMMNSILGGGMTSRLFQNIREQKGLAYSVYSHLASYLDFGMIMIYCGVEKDKGKLALKAIQEELNQMAKRGVTKEEFDLHQQQVRGQLLMVADDPDSRMQSLAINEMIFGKYRTVDEVITEFSKVELPKLNSYIKEVVSKHKPGILVVS